MDCDTTHLRKSAHGRTQLFLPSKGAILREVKCMGGVTKRNSAAVYHILPTPTAASNVVCWHCCDPLPVDGEGVPIPKLYDLQEDAFYVFGITCSPECCKAYIIEHTTYERNQQLSAFVSYMRKVYTNSAPIVEAPPRASLVRFGGPFKTEGASKQLVKTIVTPPMVSYCMLVEEHRANEEDVEQTCAETLPQTNIEEPMPPALFQGYLERRATEPAPEAPRVAKRARATKATGTGPMSKFISS